MSIAKRQPLASGSPLSGDVNRKTHLMTVIVEDYFHVGAFRQLIQQRQWTNFEARFQQNTRKTLRLLEECGAKATFFILGWIAEQNPEIVKEIADQGHEVASRGYYPRGLSNLSPQEFRLDLARSRDVLEKASGKRVIGYRAAEKCYFGRDDWILDVLITEGFHYDASFVPSSTTPGRRRVVHQSAGSEGTIWEIPYSTMDLGFRLWPISGGNYLRQIPFTLMRRAIASWDARFDEPYVFYFHIWELDPEQPRISAATFLNRIRHYRKLDKMEWIIRENTSRYRFSDIASYLGIDVNQDSATLGQQILEQSNGEPLISKETRTISAAVTQNQPITIVVPCFNEEESIPFLVNSLRKLRRLLFENGFDLEIIFVDDCSTDSTLAILRQTYASDSTVRVLQHDRNSGVAAAILTGIREARTEIVCSIDCDCTYDPFEIVPMLARFDTETDMITASPYHPDGGVRNVPGWRLFLSKGAALAYRFVLKSKLNTYTSCFRIYRKSSVSRIEIENGGFLGVAEMLGKLDLMGGRIVEYPTMLNIRLFGFSKMRTLATIFGHLRLLTKLAIMRIFRKKPRIITE